MTDLETTIAIKQIHAILRDGTRRYGIEQRALLLTLAFLKGKPVESQERTTSARTRYTWNGVPELVAAMLEKRSEEGRCSVNQIILRRLTTFGVFDYAAFPLDAFKAWYGDPALRVKEYIKAVAELPADATFDQRRDAMRSTLDMSDAARLAGALDRELKAAKVSLGEQTSRHFDATLVMDVLPAAE